MFRKFSREANILHEILEAERKRLDDANRIELEYRKLEAEISLKKKAMRAGITHPGRERKELREALQARQTSLLNR